MSKDYYKILGLQPTESDAEIKSAYRRLARKWHPDVAGNTPDVLNKFKEINEAYEILSNKTQKAEYDRARRFYEYAKGNSQNKTETNKNNETHFETKEEEIKPKFKWEEFISRTQNTFKQKTTSNEAKRGKDIFTDIDISVSEAINGVNKTINMLKTEVCPKCGGKRFANGTICNHCKGKGEVTNYKKFTVRIPAGIRNNSKIRLAGEGEKGSNGGKCGDLYITVNIYDENEYKTEGLNIYKTVKIAPYEAVLGTDIKIPVLGGNLSFHVCPNTQNGQKIRLAGCGIVQNDKIGDMIVTIEICIPKNISEDEISLYTRLRELASKNIGENTYD